MLIFNGLVALLTELYERADAERSDPELLRRQMLELETRYEWGEIPEEEYLPAYIRLKTLLQQALAAAADAEEEDEEEEEEEEEE